jgi:hypothetical protein
MEMFTRIISLTPAIIREQQTQPAPTTQRRNCKQPAQPTRFVLMEAVEQLHVQPIPNVELTVSQALHIAKGILFIRVISHIPVIILGQPTQHVLTQHTQRNKPLVQPTRSAATELAGQLHVQPIPSVEPMA